MYQDDKFKSGQLWKYKTRDGEDKSRLMILKVEKPKNEVIVHVSVINAKIKNPRSEGGFSNNIGHLPFSKKAVLESVTDLESPNNDLPDYQDGYKQWKVAYDKEEGGVFSISLIDAISYVEKIMNQ